MKFVCTQENFSRGLSTVSHVASKNVTLPILNNLLIRAGANQIELLSTNLEIGITASIRGKVEQEGAYTVPARLLDDYISVLPQENISLELTDNGLLIKSQRSRTLVKGSPAEDFPIIPTLKREKTVRVEAASLRRALGQVLFAAATDEMRPEISGVYVAISGKTMTLVATDSYRLAEKTVSCDNTSKSAIQVIVPLPTLHELVRILGDDSGEVALALDENQILFDYNEIHLISRLVEGTYPDYKQIIPTTSQHRAEIDVAELTKVIKAASLFCKPGINDVTLTLKPDEKQAAISAANSQAGESTSTVDAKLGGGEIAVVFNYRYLLEGLAALGSETAIIELTSGTNPGLLKPAGADDYRHIIMPIRQ